MTLHFYLKVEGGIRKTFTIKVMPGDKFRLKHIGGTTKVYLNQASSNEVYLVSSSCSWGQLSGTYEFETEKSGLLRYLRPKRPNHFIYSEFKPEAV